MIDLAQATFGPLPRFCQNIIQLDMQERDVSKTLEIVKFVVKNI